MYLLRFFIIAACHIFCISVYAQSAKTDIPVLQSVRNKDSVGGTVNLHQDPRIEDLLQKHVRSAEAAPGIDGWRIQIYNSSGRVARDEANEERTRFLNKYPDLKAYLIYQPPYFKIRVGDYRSKQEAYKMYKQIVKQFPVSYLVPDKINLPHLNQY